jgi:transposase
MTNPGLVVAGVDTHADTHHVAVIDGVGRRVTDRQFPATAVGYRQIVEFLNAQGPVGAVGVEGTGSYGAELARSLARAGLSVIEVTCSNRSARRLRGKSDPLDAYAAAQAVLAEQAQSVPKSRDGLVEAIRVLRVARGSAIKSRTIAINQIKAILVTAEDGTRASYRGLTNLRMIEALARSRPRTATASAAGATAVSLKILATRCQSLNAEISILDAQLDELTNQLAPGLKAVHGVGTEVAAQLLITAGDNPERITTEARFAALVGVAPIPASSGKTTRHRLSRGGDRAANAAIHRIVLVRMSTDQRTRDYVTRRRTEGLSTKEIMRCLKRFVAREMFHHLTNPPPAPLVHDLRPARLAANHTLASAAVHLETSPNQLSRLERGKTRNPDLEHRYREWLAASAAHAA